MIGSPTNGKVKGGKERGGKEGKERDGEGHIKRGPTPGNVMGGQNVGGKRLTITIEKGVCIGVKRDIGMGVEK
jgi:hypothetical protein